MHNKAEQPDRMGQLSTVGYQKLLNVLVSKFWNESAELVSLEKTLWTEHTEQRVCIFNSHSIVFSLTIGSGLVSY